MVTRYYAGEGMRRFVLGTHTGKTKVRFLSPVSFVLAWVPDFLLATTLVKKAACCSLVELVAACPWFVLTGNVSYVSAVESLRQHALPQFPRRDYVPVCLFSRKVGPSVTHESETTAREFSTFLRVSLIGTHSIVS